jgi:hypothetical protein
VGKIDIEFGRKQLFLDVTYSLAHKKHKDHNCSLCCKVEGLICIQQHHRQRSLQDNSNNSLSFYHQIDSKRFQHRKLRCTIPQERTYRFF